MTCWSYLSASHHLTWAWLHTATSVVVVHFVLKWSCSNRSTSFENAKLLIEDLRVGKSLILGWLTKMWWAHYLLWHHQIVLLWSIYTLLALYRSYTIAWWLDSSVPDCTNISNSSNTGWHAILSWWKLFDSSWSIWIFSRNFGTVTFQSNHTTTNTHYGLLISHLTLIVVTLVLLLWIHLTIIYSTTSMALISKSSVHHICLWYLATT